LTVTLIGWSTCKVAMLLVATAPTSTTSAAIELLVPTPPAPRIDPIVLPQLEPETGWPRHYPRVRPLEYVAIAALAAANITTSLWLDGFDRPIWTGNNALDDALLDATDLSDTATARLTLVGDWTQRTLLVAPLIFDSLLLAGIVHGDFDTAFQTGLISLLSTLGASLSNYLVKVTLTRARAGTPPCEGDNCPAGGTIHSFPSGHASASFNGAGLICIHHEMLELLGGGWPEHLTCAVALSGAALASFSRLPNRAHYFTDLVGGAAMGLVFGLVVPYLLHYQYGEMGGLAVVPDVSEGGATVSIHAQF
jgi:membrane-associated phospholipid phosphatase